MVENDGRNSQATGRNLLTTLRQDHEATLARLEQLHDSVDDLGSGDICSAVNRLRQLLTFFDVELPMHFRREEEVLFPALRRFLAGAGPILLDGEVPDVCGFLFCVGLCRKIGPEAVYLRDHQALLQSIDSLRHLARQLEQAGGVDAASLPRAEQIIRQVQWELTSHIAKETEVLIPKAEEVLSPAVLARLGMATERLSPRASGETG